MTFVSFVLTISIVLSQSCIDQTESRVKSLTWPTKTKMFSDRQKVTSRQRPPLMMRQGRVVDDDERRAVEVGGWRGAPPPSGRARSASPPRSEAAKNAAPPPPYSSVCESMPVKWCG